MKFWTVQSQKVLDIVENDGIYHPKFAISQYYKQYSELYEFMLKSFNSVNNLNCEGLIYAFCISNKDMIYSIANIEGFRYFMNLNNEKINCLWGNFTKNKCKILELEMNLDFNDLALAFNDFQYIMPSPLNNLVFGEFEYQANCKLIRANVQKGIIMCSGNEGDLIQSHLPYIKKSDIINVYELFDLD